MSDTEKTTYIDPVCGMTVTDLTKPHTEWQGQNYYFCSENVCKSSLQPQRLCKLKIQTLCLKLSGCCGSPPKRLRKKTSCGAPKPQIEPDSKRQLLCIQAEGRSFFFFLYFFPPKVASLWRFNINSENQCSHPGSAEFIDPVCGMSGDPKDRVKNGVSATDLLFLQPVLPREV